MKTETSRKQMKETLRDTMRYRRGALDPALKSSMDSAINRFLAGYLEQTGCSTVAAFWPFDGEPDLRPALDLLERQGIRLVLPVIDADAASPFMKFHQWSTHTEMRENRFGIPEPQHTAEVLLFDVDVILLPLVAWDPTGGRLGMGAGFYDRALQVFGQSDSPLRTGVAYQLQRVDQVPADPWDIHLHAIISEAGWFSCQPINDSDSSKEIPR